MMMANEMSKGVVPKRRKKKRRDLAPKTGANNVESWGTESNL